MDKSPVIFVAFANDLQNPDSFLKALEPERTELHRIFGEYNSKDWGQFHSCGSSHPGELKKDLIQFTNRIIIFHFSGHANGTQIQLEGSEGEPISLHANNLLSFLKGEERLKLVILNACATYNQVKHL